MGFKRKCYLVAKVQKKKEIAKHFFLKLMREESYVFFRALHKKEQKTACPNEDGRSNECGQRKLLNSLRTAGLG